MTTTRRAFGSVALAIALVTVLHVVGLALFTRGFLLQRVELPHESTCAPRAAWTIPTPPADIERQLPEWDAALDPAHAGECALPPRYSRVVLWIIDSLRYDFVAPVPHDSNATWANPYIHGILTTPARVHARARDASFLGLFVADPPTTTLQRLKGLTTGSLPTFIEAGANFGGAGRVREDNWIAQFRRHIGNASGPFAFVGDDTWATVFSDLFDSRVEWPYSSFNVEDLDTVDAGVTERMLGLLDARAAPQQSTTYPSDWRLLIAHSLGVDHVGHRFGAAHPRMVPKLAQMDRLVQDVVARLDDDTLFLLLGDHGMDATGDHGGDTELEVGAALWAHAKKPFCDASAAHDIPDLFARANLSLDAPFTLVPGTHRATQQIDLVPTLALLLGTPVPFNNLGTAIPEFFCGDLAHRDSRLLRALRINARQIRTYLAEYTKSAEDLARYEPELTALWERALRADAHYARLVHARAPLRDAALDAAAAYLVYTRTALEHARSVWAQFDVDGIVGGLVVLCAAAALTAALWAASRSGGAATPLLTPLVTSARVPLVCAIAAAAAREWLKKSRVTLENVAYTCCTVLPLLGIFGVARMQGAQRNAFSERRSTTIAGAALALTHAALFASNSLTMWEDRVTLALVALVLIIRAVFGCGSSSVHLRYRIPLLAIGSMLLLRTAATARICREEQAPHCTPSFYARPAVADARFADNPAYALAGPATNSIWMIALAYIGAYFAPDALRRVLAWSRTEQGTARAFLVWLVRPALLGAAAYWLADYAHGLERWDEDMRTWLLHIKTLVARVDLAALAVGAIGWAWAPLCITTAHEQVGDRRRTVVLGYGNMLGSGVLLITTLLYALLFLLAQPTGQVTLTLCYLAMVLFAELGDLERDSRYLERAKDAQGPPVLPPPAPTLVEIATVALSGYLAFFATGHQAIFSAIQWRTAFVGFTTVSWPFSPIFVVLNALGPLVILPAFGVVLLTVWNIAPRRKSQGADGTATTLHLSTALLRASMGFILYHTLVALSSAIFATHFRRHLMVFKIWAPRYMLAALTLLAADVSLLLGVGAVALVAGKVQRVFGTPIA